MKGKWLFFIVLSIMLTMVAPVLAEPAVKIPVTAQTFNQVNTEPGKTWTTNGGIVHFQDVVRTGEVWLKIGDEPAIYGTIREPVQYIINNGMFVLQNHNIVWTFGDDTFEGQKILKREYANPTTIIEEEQHAVLHGTGAFKGQTLVISIDWVAGDPLPRLYSGYLLIP